MRILPFDALGYHFTDVTHGPRMSKAALHFRQWSNEATVKLRLDDDARFCRIESYPEPENPHITLWAEDDAGEFFGTFSLYKIRTLSKTPRRWRIAAYGMATFKLPVDRRKFWRLSGELMQKLLDEDMPMQGGGVLDVERWIFPSPKIGDAVEHIWGLEETAGAVEVFKNYETEESDDTRMGRRRTHLKAARKEVLLDGDR